jgi:lipopolysaccharide transport system ATP-binding protein
MRDVATDAGRTILFVSHNLGALTQLCKHGVLLENGTVKTIGPIEDVIKTYLHSGPSENSGQVHFAVDPAKPCQFVTAEIVHSDGNPGADFSCDEPVTIRFTLDARQKTAGTLLMLYIQNLEGTRVLFSDIRDTDPAAVSRIDVGLHAFEVEIPARLLAPTTYLVTLICWVHFRGTVDERHACCEFTLRDLVNPRPNRQGVLGALLPWNPQVVRQGEAG